jgi:hypothetical protein
MGTSWDPRARVQKGRRLRSVSIAVAVAVGMAAGGAGPVGAAGDPVVTAAAQVTSDPNPVRAHSTPQIAYNPKTGELVLVESDPRSATRACTVHLSTDRGRSWAPGGDPMVRPFTDCSFYAEYGPYATLAFASDGRLYMAFVASEPLNRIRNETPRHVFLARSEDSGRTFQTTTVFKAPDGNQDRGLNKGPMLAVDPNEPARVYVGWRQGIFANNATEKLKSNIATSVDGGRTFGEPVDLTDERGGDYPAIAVDGKGTVHAVYWTRTGVASAPPPPTPPVRPIQYVRSTDRGRTFSRPEPIDPGNQRADRPPLLAADPKTDALYMVWYGHADPNNMAQGFQGDLEIFFRASDDGGRRWSDRLVLNDDKGPSKVHQVDPGISLAPNGRIDVAWYDARYSPKVDLSSNTERGFQDVFATSSTDGGRTFTANVRITDRSIDRSIGVWSNNVDSHYNVGIASADDAAFFAWQDSRNGNAETNAEDVYVAALEYEGTIPEAESPSFAWGLLALGLALGLGVGMVAIALFSRRSAHRPATVDAQRGRRVPAAQR